MEEALHALLTADAGVAAIVGARVTPYERLQGGALPALTYARISGRRDYAHDGPTGFSESRVQLDAWADPAADASAYGTAKAAARAAVAAVSGYRGTVGPTRIGGIFVEAERDLRGDTAGDTQRLARVSLDLTIWHTE